MIAFYAIQIFHVIFDFAFCKMLEAFTRKLLKHFIEVGFCITSRGQAFAETVILSFTSGDVLLCKGLRISFGC